MKTNQAYTFEALGGYLMCNNSVNAGSLAENIEVTCMNDSFTYEYMTERRKNFTHSAESVAKMWLCSWVNAEIKYCYGRDGYFCTYAQIKKFNVLHNNSINDVIKLLIEYITTERENY